MNKPFDVLIIGGGIVGLATAVAMAKRRLNVAVIDRDDLAAQEPARDQRVYAINHASRTLLQQLGAWSYMDKARIAPYQHMHVWDAASHAVIDFDARMIANDELGAIIEQSVIKQALLTCIASYENISCFPLTTVTQVLSNDDGLTIRSGQRVWQTRLLIVADGGNSPIRHLLAIPITSWPYHQHAVVATVHTEKAHDKTAWQVFNPSGPLAFLPLVDPHQCSIVWSTSAQHAEQLMALPEEAFNEELSQAFAHRLGQTCLLGKRYQFPLIMRHASHYVGKNWVLVGDAAHTIHPLAGLGLNVGLADVAALMTCFDHSPTAFVTKKALAAYQRQRKHAVWQLIALLEGLKTLFANPLPPVIALRGLGLGLCNRWTPIKRLFINHAAGQQEE